MQPFHFKMFLITAFFNEIALPFHGIAQSHVVNKVNRCMPPPLPTHESRKEDSDGEHCFLILMHPPPLFTNSHHHSIHKQTNNNASLTKPLLNNQLWGAHILVSTQSQQSTFVD